MRVQKKDKNRTQKNSFFVLKFSYSELELNFIPFYAFDTTIDNGQRSKEE